MRRLYRWSPEAVFLVVFQAWSDYTRPSTHKLLCAGSLDSERRGLESLACWPPFPWLKILRWVSRCQIQDPSHDFSFGIKVWLLGSFSELKFKCIESVFSIGRGLRSAHGLVE